MITLKVYISRIWIKMKLNNFLKELICIIQNFSNSNKTILFILTICSDYWLNNWGKWIDSTSLIFLQIIFGAVVALATAQSYHGDPKTAAIISEQRYLAGDGKFGAAYTQEDGINFKEETDADGTRHGSYSYVDPTGQRRTISYTAGKNG